MKKIKNWLFPQKGKEKSTIRLYIVLTYTTLVLGIIFTFVQTFRDIAEQNNLYAKTVQKQLLWALLDSSITSETVRAFQDSKISGFERDLSKFSDGYDYKNQLLLTEIPNLASQAENQAQAYNIRKVGDILEQNIEGYRSARLEIFSPTSAIVDGLLYVIAVFIPLFIFFRAVVYRIVLYIIFGK